jgi:hypothetical protein
MAQRLDARDNEAGRRSTYYGNLADTFEQSFDLRGHPRIGDLSGRNFDEGNKVGRIEPVYVEETMRMLDRIRKLIDKNRRCGGGEDYFRPDRSRCCSKYFPFQIKDLGYALEDNAGSCKRDGAVARRYHGNPLDNGFGICVREQSEP